MMDRPVPQQIVRRRITVSEYLDGTYDIDELDLAPRVVLDPLRQLEPGQALDVLEHLIRP